MGPLLTNQTVSRMAQLRSKLLVLPALIAAVLGRSSSAEVQQVPAASQSRASLYANNFADGRYFNPWGEFEKSAMDLLKVAVGDNPYDKSQAPDIPSVYNDGSELSTEQASAKITWVGHATAIIHDGPDVVITDPHFSERALLPKRKTAPGVPLSAIPTNAFAVISHNHYDHLDEETVEALPEEMFWFVPAGLGEWFEKLGRSNVVELNWWESAYHGRWTITCVPAQHWSRRFGQPTNSTLWSGWVLDSGEYRYYYAGDTGYFHGFKEIGERFGPIDVALLPIGAYEPRWFMGYQHVNPAEAYQAFLDVKARYMIPVHWGAFDLSYEPLDQPPKDLRQAIADRQGDPDKVKILAIGEGWHVPPATEPAGLMVGDNAINSIEAVN